MIHPTITYLKQLLTAYAPGSVAYRLTEAKLAALTGDVASANATLDSLLEELGANAWNEHFAFINAVHIGILTRRLRLVADLLNHRYDTGRWFNLEFEESRHGVSAFLWRILSSSQSVVLLPQSLLTSHQFDLIVNRFIFLLPILAEYAATEQRELGQVWINLDDHGVVPGLAFCDNRENYFLIPDPQYLFTKGYRDIARHFADNFIPWEQRQPVAYWRGATTGRSDSKIGWRSLPRIRLCGIAAANPTLFDAGISKIVQVTPDSQKEIKSSGLMRAFAPATEVHKYKYQIDIDGNTNSWPGLFQKLLSGSPVLKVASPNVYRQWYYDRLVPDFNYVPIAADMSDLLEKLQWLSAHDAAAKEIGLRGKALADELAYESEVKRASSTITVALRHFSGQARSASDDLPAATLASIPLTADALRENPSMHTSTKRGLRTLVCVLGQVRGAKLTWTNFKRNVLDELDADLAICVGAEPHFDFFNPFYTTAKYKWLAPEYDDCAVAYDAIQRELGSAEDWRLLFSVKGAWLGRIAASGQPGTAAVMYLLRWFLLQNLEREGLLQAYDRFVITRSDFLYLCPHPPMDLLEADDIWIPDGEDHGGLTDRHLVTSGHNLRNSIDLISDILQKPSELQGAMMHSDEWNIERYIKLHLERTGLLKHVKRFPYIMYLVRAADDVAGWAGGKYDPTVGMIVKYPGELQRAKSFEPLIRSASDWRAFFSVGKLQELAKSRPEWLEYLASQLLPASLDEPRAITAGGDAVASRLLRFYAALVIDAVIEKRNGRQEKVGQIQTILKGLPLPLFSRLEPLLGHVIEQGRYAANPTREELRELLGPVFASVQFDEGWYMDTYQDIKRDVVAGKLLSGHAHFMLWGYFEGRFPMPPAA